MVVGSGAREHALAWKLHFCRDVSAIYVAPGNAGTSLLARRVPVDLQDVAVIRSIALQNRIDLTVVGPEGPLADGIVDAFAAEGLRIFGPSRAAARLETSKIWAKGFMQRHNIPTARWIAAESVEEARAGIQEIGAPLVLKADGLAGGKGVVVCRTVEEAEVAARQLLVDRAVGEAGRSIVIEELLEGAELSVFALADGAHVLPLNAARDYKRLMDGDVGPNTGGMGGYARPSYATPELIEDVRRSVLEPTVAGMAADGYPYVGVLYAGLMITREGPKVLEFNCRWGDPEAEIILPLLKTDMVDLMTACIDGRLAGQTVEWEDAVTCGVVLASRGYPVAPQIGAKIRGLDNLDEGVLVFHGATRMLETPPTHQGWLQRRLPQQFTARELSERDIGTLVDGGRALILVAKGETLERARATAYANVHRIDFDGMQYRSDIGASDPLLSELVGPGWVPQTAPLPLGRGVDLASPVLRAEGGEVRTSPPAAIQSDTLPDIPLPTPSLLGGRGMDDLSPQSMEPDRHPSPEGSEVVASVAPPPLDVPSAFQTPTQPHASIGADPRSEPRPVTEGEDASQVAVIMGSESDRPIMEESAKILHAMGIPHEVHVMSAHRTPERVRQFARSAEGRGIRVVIAGAGGAAHLPGVIAAQTTVPVIGVPIQGSSMMGLDSLLSIVQMPGGVPVATVAVGNAGARNAAYLAAAIIGLADEAVRARYRQFRVEQSGGELA
jgi:phosphoribosylamine--glycine ligase